MSRGGGELTAGNADYFSVIGLADGTLDVRVTNRGNSENDDELTLLNGAGTTTLATGTLAGRTLTASTTVGGTPTQVCIKVAATSSSSTGSYRLSVDFVPTPPDVTSVTNMYGTAISSASPGMQIKLVGTGFNTSAEDVFVTFGGTNAKVLYANKTEIRVLVPARAVDGDIVVSHAGGADTWSGFTVGRSTPWPTLITMPDPAWYDETSGIYFNRVIIGFDAGVSSAQVASMMDTVVAADSTRAAWTAVSIIPELNVYEVEWSWVSTYTPTPEDLYAILDELDGYSAILSLDPQAPIVANTLAPGDDWDFLHASADAKGAMAQIGAAEMRRLFRYSGLTEVATPAVVVLDSGLWYGDSAAWPSGDVEFPAAGFALFELDAGAWTASTSGYLEDDVVGCHGCEVTSIIAARSGFDPDWADGEERPSDNMSGILGGLDLPLVDDDGDSDLDGDDVDGEAIPVAVTVYNALGNKGATGHATSLVTVAALVENANDASQRGVPTNISLGFGSRGWKEWASATGKDDHTTVLAVLKRLCSDRLVVVAAGNSGLDVDDTSADGGLALAAAEACPTAALIVGGTNSGELYDGSDSWATVGAVGANFGDSVSLLAPFDGWTLAGHEGSASSGSPVYRTDDGGTSLSAPAVTASASLLQALLPYAASPSELADRLIAAGDDLAPVYDKAGSTIRLNLHRAVREALVDADVVVDALQPPRLLVMDWSANKLYAREVDPDDGSLTGTAASVTFDTAYCEYPTGNGSAPSGRLSSTISVRSLDI